MKIAVLTPSWPPYRGGMGNVAYNFAKQLAGRGHEVTVFTPRYDRNVREPEKLNGLTVKRLPPWLKYGQAAFVPQLVFKLKNFDIIHLHFPFIGGVEFLFLKFLVARQAKLILHYHMDLVGVGVFKFIFTLYKLKTLPWLVYLSDRIIVTSRDYFLSSFLSKILRKQNKLLIIPNGIDYHHFSTREQILPDQILVSEEKSIALFVGGLDQAHYFKGVKILLRAWQQVCVKKRLVNPLLIIVGDGDLKPDYQSLAKELKLEKLVQFTGRVADSKLPGYYQLAKVTILPSIDKTEAFGLVLLESLAAGTPVIASDLAGVRTLVKEGQTGWLVQPGNQGDLAAKIIMILSSQKKQWRDNCLTMAKQYDWAVVTKQLEDLMCSLCG